MSEKDEHILDKIFDEFQHYIKKGMTLDNIQDIYDGKSMYLDLEQVKEWKRRYGYKLEVYSNDHFINNKPHFHIINKANEIDCKVSFDGEIFECKGNPLSKKIKKEIIFFTKTQKKTLVEMWNLKNPDLLINQPK